MGLLKAEERERLLMLLMQLPGVTEPDCRAALTDGISPALRATMPRTNNTLLDLYSILNTIDSDGARQADRSWPILTVIENARQLAADPHVHEMLTELHHVAEAREHAPAPSAEPQRLESGSPVALREFIAASLSASELQTLCFDYFQPVYRELDVVSTKEARIRMLIDFCERRGQLQQLVHLVRQSNPYQYQRFEQRLGE
jgi:hypothetical protein